MTDRFLGSQIVMMIMLQIPGFLRSVCHTSSRVFLPDLQAMNNALRFGTWRLPNLPRSITALLYQPTAQPTTPMYTQSQAVMSQQCPVALFYTSPPQTVQQNNFPPCTNTQRADTKLRLQLSLGLLPSVEAVHHPSLYSHKW